MPPSVYLDGMHGADEAIDTMPPIWGRMADFNLTALTSLGSLPAT